MKIDLAPFVVPASMKRLQLKIGRSSVPGPNSPLRRIATQAAIAVFIGMAGSKWKVRGKNGRWLNLVALKCC